MWNISYQDIYSNYFKYYNNEQNYTASYLLNQKVIAGMLGIKGAPDFTVSFLVGLIFFMIFHNTGLYSYVDKEVTTCISGTATDYLIFFGQGGSRYTIWLGPAPYTAGRRSWKPVADALFILIQNGFKSRCG